MLLCLLCAIFVLRDGLSKKRDGLGMSGKDLKTTTIDPNRDFSDTEGRKEVETFPFGPIVYGYFRTYLMI